MEISIDSLNNLIIENSNKALEDNKSSLTSYWSTLSDKIITDLMTKAENNTEYPASSIEVEYSKDDTEVFSSIEQIYNILQKYPSINYLIPVSIIKNLNIGVSKNTSTNDDDSQDDETTFKVSYFATTTTTTTTESE